MNTYVDRIARRQAHLGGFTTSPSPSPEASADKDNDIGDDEDEDEDDDLSMTCPLSFMTKRRSSFRMKVVLYLGGELE